MKKILASAPSVFVVFLIILFAQLGTYLFQFNHANSVTPTGRVHAMIGTDSYYPDVIRQGKLGAWKHTYSLTTKPTPPIYTYVFFILAGKVAALFNIDPVVMYEITRVTGGIALILATYWLVTVMLPLSLQIPALIFTLVFETGPIWKNLSATPISQWVAASPAQEVIARHFGLPHHQWAEAFGVALIALILKTIIKPSWIAPLGIIFFAFMGPLFNPMFFLIVIVCYFGPWFFYAIKTKTVKQIVSPIVIATCAIAAAGLFTRSQFAAGTPWMYVLPTEKTWWTTDFILIPFLQSFGLFYPFALLTILLAPFGWKNWSPAMQRTFILTLCWSTLPVGMIYLSSIPWIPLVNGRIASDLSPLPIGILSTLVFYAASKIPRIHKILLPLVIIFFLSGLFVSLKLSVTYFTKTLEYQKFAVYNEGESFTHYPTLDLWNGMMALKSVPAWSHIMVLPRMGNIIPAYVPIHVYQGQPHDGDIYWLVERGWSHVFYTGEMPKDDLNKLLTENKISYVFVGPEEKSARKTEEFYPDILKKIFENPEVTIYKVNSL